MKAVVQVRHGAPEGLMVTQVTRPTPKDNEVLVKVIAATATAGDAIMRRFHPLLFLPLQLVGLRRKRTPGHEFAGVIEAVGVSVKQFKPGDAVFGTTTGLSNGANAEYVCVPESSRSGVLALKPDSISFEEAAALPVGGMTALEILRRGNVGSGDEVLIYGASGSVGTFAVQLARLFGATVTGVCSTANVELVKSLGAVRVIDYTEENPTVSEATYDVVFDAVGKSSLSQNKSSLKPKGIYLSVKSSTRETAEKLTFLKELAEAGKLKSVIDRCYSLDQIVEAHRYVDSGRKKGNVVIVVALSSNTQR